MDKAFEQFGKKTKKDWITKVKFDSSGISGDTILSGSKSEGLHILPFYTEDDLPPSLLSDLKFQKSWDYHEYLILHKNVELKNINSLLLHALQTGAAGIDFQIQGEDRLEESGYSKLLEHVQVHSCKLSFYLTLSQLESFSSFIKYASGLPLYEGMKGTLYINPSCSDYLYCQQVLGSLANLFSNNGLKNYHVLGITSAPFVNAGASAIQELAFTLSYLIACLDYLTDRGFQLSAIVNHLEITLNTQTHHFINIAKFRAIRILLSQVAEAYQMEEVGLPYWKIKAVSGIWNKTVYDPVNNMLRNTTEAMAAIIGGCNTIALIPHDFAYQGHQKFSSRMARNTSNILQYETHLDKVVDPAKGSYFMESLTHQLVIKAWQEFLSIESEGGFLEAIRKGVIQKNIADVLSQRQQDISTRRQPYIGSTRYLNPDDYLTDSTIDKNLMEPSSRGPAIFEYLRYFVDQSVAQGNPRPTVGLIILPVATEVGFINARVAFIKDILACGGIHAEEYTYENEKSLSEYTIMAKVWVICSSNQFYEHQLSEWLQKNAEVLHSKVLYLAGLPQVGAEQLKKAGIRDMLYTGADMHNILLDLLHQIGVAV